MIQFNLLPDVKLDYIRTRRRKRLVVLVSACAAGASLALLILLVMMVKVWQHQSIKDLEKDIQANNNSLQSITDINKVLTVQAQLGSLTNLHNAKPQASRMFVFLGQVTPATASISRISTNFADSTMTIAGGADSLQTVNTFVDTIKFTRFTSSNQTEPILAFKDVVLSNFARDDERANYEIDFLYNPAIFDATEENIALQVPRTVTTRSELSKPGLFDAGQGAAQ